MKIFATGDTHWNFERFRPEYFPEGQELTKKDVVLQLGDFGGVWFGDERDDEALDTLLQRQPGTHMVSPGRSGAPLDQVRAAGTDPGWGMAAIHTRRTDGFLLY